jgi:hypothetical protein
MRPASLIAFADGAHIYTAPSGVSVSANREEFFAPGNAVLEAPEAATSRVYQ